MRLVDGIVLRYVMGGLARDTDSLMPEETRHYIRTHWEEVESRTGAEFNWEFWTRCEPRRSTYPACRAVLAAQKQNGGPMMFRAIQRAYYLEARNPSLPEVLIGLAGEIGLDEQTFADQLASEHVELMLQNDFDLRRRLGATAFPSLVLEEARPAPG